MQARQETKGIEYEFSLPRLYNPLIAEKAQQCGLTVDEFLAKCFQFGLIVAQQSPERQTIEIRLGNGKRIPLKPILFDLAKEEEALKELGLDLEASLDPETEKKLALKRCGQDYGRLPEISRISLEQPNVLKPYMEEATKKVQDFLDKELTPPQRAILAKLPECTILFKANSLFPREELIEALSREYGLPSLLFRLIALFDQGNSGGKVIPPYYALFFDEGLFYLSPQDRTSLFVHEIIHAISEGNLPPILNEAATRDLTGEIVKEASPDETHFFAPSRFWRWTKAIVGSRFAHQALFSPALIEVQPNSTKRYVGHPYHETMRNYLGNDPNGLSKWDEALKYIATDSIDRAIAVVGGLKTLR